MYPEAHVHSTPNALVRHHLIDLSVLIQCAVEKASFLVSYFFLPGDLLGAVGRDQADDDLAGNPKVEDGEGVVEGVVFGGYGVVEDDGAGKASDGELLEKGRRWARCIWGKKTLAYNDDGDPCYTDVLLGAALDE